MFDESGLVNSEVAPLDPEFEAKRKEIAWALAMQRKMGRSTPMGNLANTALQAYNMYRKAPQQDPRLPQQNPGLLPAQPPDPMAKGYPVTNEEGYPMYPKAPQQHPGLPGYPVTNEEGYPW